MGLEAAQQTAPLGVNVAVDCGSKKSRKLSLKGAETLQLGAFVKQVLWVTVQEPEKDCEPAKSTL